MSIDKITNIKIGGTAHEPGGYEKQAELAGRHRDTGEIVIATHSAISIGSKQNGTTSRQFAALDLAAGGNLTEALRQSEQIRATHSEVIEREIESASGRKKVMDVIDNRIEDFKGFLRVLPRIGMVDHQGVFIDRALGIGESWSTAIAAANYEQRGIPAEEVDLTAEKFDNRLDREALLKEMSKRFADGLKAALLRGKMPVSTGHGSNLYQFFGRGYSDAMTILATRALAKDLKMPAEVVIAKKGVRGVMSADKKIVPERDTRLVQEISFDELASLRADVVHPAVLPLVSRDITLRVRDIMNLDDEGTVVTHDDVKVEGNFCKAINILGTKESAYMRVTVRNSKMIDAPGYAGRVFHAMSGRQIEMIKTSPNKIIFTVRANESDTEDIKERLKDCGDVIVRPNVAHVIMVGRELEAVAKSEITKFVEGILNKNSAAPGIISPDMEENDPESRNYYGVCVDMDQAHELALALHGKYVSGQTE